MLHEALDAGPLGHLLLGVCLGHLPWVSVNTSYDGVGERALLGSLLIAFHESYAFITLTASLNIVCTIIIIIFMHNVAYCSGVKYVWCYYSRYCCVCM